MLVDFLKGVKFKNKANCKAVRTSLGLLQVVTPADATGAV